MSKKKRKTDEQTFLKCGINCKDKAFCVTPSRFCPTCNRRDDLYYWFPSDWYQPKFATGGVVFVKAFSCEPELIISFDPAYGEDYSATVKAEKCKEGFKIVSITIDDKKETMKTENIWISDTMPDSVSVNGKKFKLVPVEEELTMEDCLKGNSYPTSTRIPLGGGEYLPIAYPTSNIAEKVLIHGLLRSVAYKLNGNKDVEIGYCIAMFGEEIGGKFNITHQHMRSGNIIFASEELAKQAISIFAKSKFDLKKLYQ